MNDYRMHAWRDGFKLIATSETTQQFDSADDAIAAALDALHETGGELHLCSGDYTLTRTVRVPSRTTLRGTGPATRLLVQEGTGVLLEQVDRSVVRDLTVQSSGPGAQRGVALSACGDCRVQDVCADGFAECGVYLGDHSFLCELRGVRAAGNGRANILLHDLLIGRGGSFVPVLVTNCITYHGGHGIEVQHAIVVNLVGCVVHQAGGHGYYIHDDSNSVLISGCRTFQIERDAVHVDNAHEFNATGNIFCWHRGHGVVLHNADWATVTGNNIIDTGVRTRDGSFTDGVVLHGVTRGVQVIANNIFNWGDQCPMNTGVTEADTCVNNTIVANAVNYCRTALVDAKGADTVIRDNSGDTAYAYRRMDKPPYPDFTREAMARFIQSHTPASLTTEPA